MIQLMYGPDASRKSLCHLQHYFVHIDWILESYNEYIHHIILYTSESLFRHYQLKSGEGGRLATYTHIGILLVRIEDRMSHISEGRYIRLESFQLWKEMFNKKPEPRNMRPIIACDLPMIPTTAIWTSVR